MKNIKNYFSEKYSSSEYMEVSPCIFMVGKNYVTSISFEQEPEFEEGSNAATISQFPMENILDKFLVYISDFYPRLNTEKSKTCYVEFASSDMDDIKKLCIIIGKHVYIKDHVQDGEVYSLLMVE